LARLLASACVVLLCAAAFAPAGDVPGAGAGEVRRIRLADLPSTARAMLPVAAQTDAGFHAYVAAIERETAARERNGEYDHLVFYLLQSRRFTAEPPIEPALSALELARGRDGEVPASVLRRVADFERALAGTPGESRLVHFKRLLAGSRPPAVPQREHLRREYARAMRFLVEKEFPATDVRDSRAREAYLARLYQERGHSTDTQVEAGFGVHTGLAVVRASGEPRALHRVLIVGPGLDFAPRTDLRDDFEPQSYQPFAVADALLSLGLSTPERLRVHCIDINPRVIAYLSALRSDRPSELRLFSGIPERAGRPLTTDYRAYFERLGTSVGERRSGILRVRPEVARRITADRLNVLTERYEPAPAYDLVVATNVLSYFDPAEQAMALANIASMLRAGGYLIHNEAQAGVESAAASAALPLLQARSVVLASGEAPLFDRVLIHQKAFESADPRTETDAVRRGR
jgi:hypothetical protein